MSFRQTLLAKLEEIKVTPESVALGIAEVMRGESVTEVYERAMDENGESYMQLKKKTISRSPKDVLNGAMLYDALRGGDLGLAPSNMIKKGVSNEELVHKRLTVDHAVIANFETLEPTVMPVQTISPLEEIANRITGVYDDRRQPSDDRHKAYPVDVTPRSTAPKATDDSIPDFAGDDDGEE